MLNTIEAEATLESCRALINQIIAGLSAEEPFVNVSSAAELLFYLERAASALDVLSISGEADRPFAIDVGLFKDRGSVLERGVKVCKQPLVNKVLGLLLTEFFPDPTHKSAAPIQRVVKLIRHSAPPTSGAAANIR